MYDFGMDSSGSDFPRDLDSDIDIENAACKTGSLHDMLSWALSAWLFGCFANVI